MKFTLFRKLCVVFAIVALSGWMAGCNQPAPTPPANPPAIGDTGPEAGSSMGGGVEIPSPVSDEPMPADVAGNSEPGGASTESAPGSGETTEPAPAENDSAKPADAPSEKPADAEPAKPAEGDSAKPNEEEAPKPESNAEPKKVGSDAPAEDASEEDQVK